MSEIRTTCKKSLISECALACGMSVLAVNQLAVGRPVTSAECRPKLQGLQTALADRPACTIFRHAGSCCYLPVVSMSVAANQTA